MGDVAATSGFLVIDKPARWTSFDVVAKLRSATGVREIGHAGTLDPFATGVLVVGFGRALKVVEYVQQLDKVYRGRIRLGQTSDTDDADGSKMIIEVATPPGEAAVRAALAKFTGSIEQVPPAYSALKVQGHRMYELARKGQTINPKPRPVTVHELTLLAYAYPHIDIETRVSSGTYIRALARDIGTTLKTGGLLETLRRTRVGSFTLEDAHTLDDVQRSSLATLLAPLETATAHLPTIALSAHEVHRLANGQIVTAPNELTRKPDLPNLAVLDNDRLLMIVSYEAKTQTLKSKKLIDVGLASR